MWMDYPSEIYQNSWNIRRVRTTRIEYLESKGFFMNPWLSLWGQKKGLIRQTSPAQVIPKEDDPNFTWRSFYQLADEERRELNK